MIVLDTSALIAILKREPGFERFDEALSGIGVCYMSTVNHFEASLVTIGREAPDSVALLDEFIERVGIRIVPFDAELALAARDAFIRFGKGRHPAGLNMGDCASYALAKSLDLPLLFKGNDFPQTDVRSALP